MARKTAKKKKTKKKVAKKKQKTSKCGKCGGTGHNARSCTADSTPEPEVKEEKATISAGPPPGDSKPGRKKKAKAPEPEEAFDLEAVPAASSMKKKKLPAGSDEAPTPADAGVPPPRLKPKIPKKRKKRSKAELAFWAATEKKLAPGSLAEAGSLTLDVPRISSGNFGVDVGLHGGLPQGRIIRVTGLPKASKTGFCLNTVAQYQAHHCSECFGPRKLCKCDSDVPDVLWIDIEHRLASMLRWVEGHGINLDSFRVMGPPSGQNVVDLVDHVIRSASQAKVGLIVLDSIAHITSQDEIKKATLDGVTIGRNAMLMNAAWRKWTSAFHSLGIDNPYKPTVLAINQIRHKVGQNYGSPETLPGGLGQGYASTVDLRFSAGPPSFVVYDEKKEKFVVKQKAYKSTFRPKPDQTPDFITVNWRITASGHCPPGRSGEFNYWLKNAHGHRCGDPDNGLQLWEYCKRYDLIEVEGHTKRLYGHESRTFDGLRELFRADPKAQRKAWVKLMGLLSDEDK